VIGTPATIQNTVTLSSGQIMQRSTVLNIAAR
jgi:hypothetical protein